MTSLETSIELAEIAKSGSRAAQIETVLASIFAGNATNSIIPEKMEQISKSARDFLVELDRKHKQKLLITETEVFAATQLALTPSPADQEKLLKKIADWMQDSETEQLQQRLSVADNLQHHFYLETTIDLIHSLQGDNPQLRFLQEFFLASTTDEETKHYPAEIANILQTTLDLGHWHAALCYFNSDQRKEIHPEIYIESIKEATAFINELWSYYEIGVLEDTINRRLSFGIFEEQLNSLATFFSSDSNKETHQELFNKWLKIFLSVVNYNSITSLHFSPFLTSPENRRYLKPKMLQKILDGSLSDNVTGLFFSKSENAKQYPDLAKKYIDDCVSQPRTRSNIFKLLHLLSNPQNQQGYEDLVSELLSLAAPDSSYNVTLIIFFSFPENQKKYAQRFDSLREEVFINNPLILSSLYENHSLDSIDKKGSALEQKCFASLAVISDKELRKKAIALYARALRDASFPLALLLTTPTDKLLLVVSGYFLGISPLVTTSWQLSKEYNQSFIAVLLDLAIYRANADLFSNLALPFNPRNKEQSSSKIETQLLNWFTTIRLFYSLPAELQGKKSTQDHFERIEELQRKYAVTQTTRKLPIEFRNEINAEIKRFRESMILDFKKLVSIESSVTFEEFTAFIDSWNDDISSITVLATQYSKDYPQGLPLLGNNIDRMIHGEYERKRYDITDEVTAKQLAPLVDGVEDPSEKREVIAVWREPQPKLNILRSEAKTTKTASQNFESVANTLYQQLSLEGQNHLALIFTLPEFANATEEDQSFLTRMFTSTLSINSPKIPFDVSRLKEICKKCELSEKKQTIIIKLGQLLKNIGLGNTRPEKLHETILSLLKETEKFWPSLAKTEVFDLDLGVYAVSQFDDAIRMREISDISNGKIFLSFITDHPKTLLEIGKYPNPSSCQNFESHGSLVSHLVGYVFDAQILASIVVEVDGSADFVERMNQSLTTTSIEIDEGREVAKITFSDATEHLVKISKPCARRILMLGAQEASGSPYIVQQQLYRSGNISKETADEYLLAQRDEKLKALRRFHPNIVSNTTNQVTSPVKIGPSHNPAGHYNDMPGHKSNRSGYVITPLFATNNE